MESKFLFILSNILSTFRSYLRGMESLLNITYNQPALKFYSDPTYEAWKGATAGVDIPGLADSFRSYLRGMESVVSFALYLLLIPYSDPTYEAWKVFHLSYIFIFTRIPILPTRHGKLYKTAG